MLTAVRQQAVCLESAKAALCLHCFGCRVVLGICLVESVPPRGLTAGGCRLADACWGASGTALLSSTTRVHVPCWDCCWWTRVAVTAWLCDGRHHIVKWVCVVSACASQGCHCFPVVSAVPAMRVLVCATLLSLFSQSTRANLPYTMQAWAGGFQQVSRFVWGAPAVQCSRLRSLRRWLPGC